MSHIDRSKSFDSFMAGLIIGMLIVAFLGSLVAWNADKLWHKRIIAHGAGRYVTTPDGSTVFKFNSEIEK